jgi:TRAP-type C4-dicarboxylate transport system permease small subunit
MASACPGPALFVIGAAAVTAALGFLFYVIIYGYRDAHPSGHRNPDWMTVLLRTYKRPLTAMVILWFIGLAALVSAEVAQRLAP